jgi:[acyl-carrier-protein] S-malonyltransferase
MAAIIGLDRESVISYVKSIISGGVSGGHFNAPGQIVISGEREAVDKAVSMCKVAGPKGSPLKSAPLSYCSLMRPVADRLRESFSRCSWNRPKCL